MADSIGSLSVDVGANIASLVTEMQRAQGVVAKTFDNISSQVEGLNKAFGKVGSAFAAIGVGLSVGAFVSSIKSVIDYADHLHDLSERSGIAVEALGSLGYAAKQSGVDLDTVAKGVQKLAQNMADAAGGNKELSQLFANMKVPIQDLGGALRPLNDVLLDVADKFASYRDGPEKAALANDIFKKGGEALIPLLNLGKQKLQELREEYEKYGGVSTDTANRADLFNDTLERIHLIQGALFREIASTLLPTFQAIANVFLDAKTKGEGFRGVAEGVTVVVKSLAIAGLVVAQVFSQIGKALGAVGAMVGAVLQGDFKRAVEINRMAGADISADWAKTGSNFTAIWSASTADMAASALRDVPKTTAPFKHMGKAVKDAVDEAGKAMEQFRKLIADAALELAAFFKTDRITKADKALAEFMQTDRWAKLTLAEQANVTAMANVASETEKTTNKLKEWAEASGEFARDRAREFEDFQKQQADATAGYQSLIDKLNVETATMGMTSEARERYIAMQQLERDMANGLIATYDEYLDRLNKVNDAFGRRDRAAALDKDLKDQQKGWTDLFTSIADRGARFITDFVAHGSSSFKNLWADFKTWALEALAKIAVQKIIVAVAASFGGTAASAATSLFGSGGSGSSITSLFSGGGGGSNFLSNLFSRPAGGGEYGMNDRGLGLSGSNLGTGSGLFGVGSSGFSLGGAALGAGIGAGIGTFAASAFGNERNSSTMQIGGTIGGIAGSFFGPIGSVIGSALGSAIGSLFSSGGGAKTGGYATSGVDVGTGQSIAGITGDRFFTPDQSDATIVSSVAAISTGYLEAARALGINAGRAQFALGFDTDPQGTAQSRVSAGVSINGASIFQHRDVDAGRDDASLQTALALEAKRAIFAALKASDMPKFLGQLFDGLDASTATTDQIERVIGTATAIKTVADTIPSLADQFKKMDPAQINAFVDSLGGLAAFTQSQQFIAANFTTSADRFTKAQTDLTKGFADLGLAVPATHQAFLDLLGSFDLTTEAGRTMYASVSRLGPMFVSVAGSADQAAAKLASAMDFYHSHFFTDQEQLTSNIASGWAVVNRTYSQNATLLHSLGYDHIPTTNAGFRAFTDTLLNSTDPAVHALGETFVGISPVIFELNDNIGKLGDTAETAATQIATAVNVIVVSAGSVIHQAADLANTLLGQFSTLADASPGDFGAKLGIQLNLIADSIAHADVSQFSSQLGFDTYVGTLQGASDHLADQLGRFTILSAQYDSSRAEQLVALQDWYAEQELIFSRTNNTAALDALRTIFDQKWTAIVDGVKVGVDGTLGELDRLRKGIADYLKGLFVGDLSPLTPLQKLQTAKQAYEAELAKAQGGDVGALGDVTKFADVFLNLQRQFSASSPAYTDVFGQVTSDLGTLAGTLPNGQPIPTTSADVNAALSSALPKNGELASNADLQALGDRVDRLIVALADANTSDSAAEREALKAAAQEIATAVSGPELP